ncbi:MAG: hypothetical protein DRN64_00720 [Thaumarchaeota archaeon]|nr:MAG: hypothetical protein DRN64_00720 [Nitrososphaerota archaeon]
MRDKLKLVSFDAWNTLLKLETIAGRISEGIGGLLDVKPEKIFEKMIETYEDLVSSWLLGDLDDRRLLSTAQKTLASSLGTSAELVARGVARGVSLIDPGEVLYPEVVEVVERLSKNYVLAIVSNIFYWPGSYTRLLLEKAGIAGFFKAQLYADEIGISKPDRRIFAEACRLCGVTPGEAVHVGDSLIEDVGGALSAGMKAILLRRGSRRFQILKDASLAIIPDLTKLEEAVELLE